MTNEIEQAKANGQYERAGQLAAIMGRDDNYGCHYGMTHTRAMAVRLFRFGWADVDRAIRTGDARRD